MRLESIHTTKLFGIFDHDIRLNLDDRVTIIHGPNGYGKTTILRMVAGLFQSDYTVLRETPFESLVLCFGHGKQLVISHNDGEVESTDGASLCFQTETGEGFILPPARHEDVEEMTLNALDDFIPGLERVGEARWLFRPRHEFLDLDGVLARFGSDLPFGVRNLFELPGWFAELRDALDVYFVRANRLEGGLSERRNARGRRFESPSAVGQYADELATRIQATLTTYAELSQKLDRSFPSRLVEKKVSCSTGMDGIRSELSELESRRNDLTRVGLLDREEHPQLQIQQDVDESTADVLSVYIDDAKEKLAVFEDLFDRVSLFLEMLNRRFQFKTVAVNRTDGIVFQSPDGSELAPRDLSSGEQHEVVLLYQLLFKVSRPSLILIDEPELSLHVAWQEQFLIDLGRITELSKFDALIATHSPQIISDRWDLTVQLRGPTDAAVSAT